MFSVRKSLTRKLVFWFAITTIVPILIAGILTFSLASETLEHENFSKLNSITELKVRTIESIFGEIQSDTILAQKYLNVRTNLPIISQYYEDISSSQYVNAKKELDEQLSVYLREKTLVENIILLDENGIFVYQTNKDISRWFGLNFPFIDSIVLESAKTQQQFTKIAIYELYHPYATIFSIIGIYDANNEFVGYYVLELEMDEIFELIQDTTGLGNTGETLLGIKEGNFAVFINPLKYDPNASFTRKIALDDEIARPIREAVQGIDGADLTIDYRPIPVIAVWKHIPSLNWGIVAKIDQAEVFSPINALQQNNISLAVSFTVIVGIIGFIISRNIAKPILRLKENAELISHNKYPPPIITNGQDELASFIRTFNQMSEDLYNSRKSLQDFRNALDKSTTVTITDKNGIITSVNEKFCQLSKYSKDELIGKNHSIMKSGYHSNEFYENMWNTLKNKQTWYGLIKNKAKDGKYFWLDSVMIPILDEDENIYQFLAIRNDVTQQKLFESELTKIEKFQIIGELSSKIAHDMLNPLTVLQNSLKIIQEKKIYDDVILREINRMLHSITRIEHQVNQVLNYVKKTPLQIIKTTALTTLSDCMDLIQIPDNITIEMDDKDIDVMWDEQKITILFSNIILNAIQAIRKDEGKISVRFYEMNDTIKIEIENSGPNIDEKNIDKIFEPLFTTKMEGTGLGLASCKNIVDSHKGTISVKNNPVKFTISLPKNMR